MFHKETAICKNETRKVFKPLTTERALALYPARWACDTTADLAPHGLHSAVLSFAEDGETAEGGCSGAAASPGSAR
jgi:hypothetical protein